MHKTRLARLLEGGNHTSLELSLAMARRLVSPRTGVISSVQFQPLKPDEPAVYWARSRPGRTSHLLPQSALAQGDGVSVTANRAVMKAVGETIERYCSAWCDYASLTKGTRSNLGAVAVDPSSFCHFSERQYSSQGFRFHKANDHTELAWISAISAMSGELRLVPAAFSYVPYDSYLAGEPQLDYPISTGMACGSNWASALYKSILEAIERDHFMIAWHHELPLPRIDLLNVVDPLAQKLVAAATETPFSVRAFDLTLDIGVPIVLVVFSSKSGTFPLTAVGLGADLSPSRALILALEEALLGVVGMGRFAVENAAKTTPFIPSSSYDNIRSLDMHGLSHAIDSSLIACIDRITSSGLTYNLTDIEDRSTGDISVDLQTILGYLQSANLEVFAVDLTTGDVADVGFRVVRALIPSLLPLDIDHLYRHLGGKRLYSVAAKLGFPPRLEHEFNYFPHPFP